MAGTSHSEQVTACTDVRKEALREKRPTSDEPQSKRVRITLCSHAEVVEAVVPCAQGSTGGASSAGQAEGDLQKGARVFVRGVESRPELNGQAGQLLGFNAKQSRWLVSLDDGTKKLITANNLQLQSEAGESAINQEDKTSGSTSPTAEQLLRIHLEEAKSQAKRHIEETCAQTCATVSQLRSDVDNRCSRHEQQFEHYCQMTKPTNHEEQRSRNAVRDRLREQGQAVQSSLQRLLSASAEPVSVLRSKEAEVLEQIDGAILMLTCLREDATSKFAEYAEKLDLDRRSTEETVKALIPAVNIVDKFMQRFAEEMRNEQAEAERIYNEMLQKLEKEEAVFVEVNDSPAWNPQFARVQAELAALKQRCQERNGSYALNLSLIQSWDSLRKSLPSKQPDVAQEEQIAAGVQPQRPKFWHPFSYFTRVPGASV